MTTRTPLPPAGTPERIAFDAGARKGASICPGRPVTEAAKLPTAAERAAFIDGWFSVR